MLPLIESQKILLRPPQLGDEFSINKAINESLPELQRWMPWAKDPSLGPTIKFVKDAIEQWSSDHQSDFPLIVIDQATKNIIGASGFNSRSRPEVPMFEIGYWISSAYTNQGFCSEVVKELTKFAFQTFKANRVQIVTQVGNEASRKVAEKNGFLLEATLKNYCIDPVSDDPADDWLLVRFDAKGL